MMALVFIILAVILLAIFVFQTKEWKIYEGKNKKILLHVALLSLGFAIGVLLWNFSSGISLW